MCNYGYCPECGARGVMRERRKNGDDRCESGHIYPSSSATKSPAGFAPPLVTGNVAPLKERLETIRQKASGALASSLYTDAIRALREIEDVAEGRA